MNHPLVFECRCCHTHWSFDVTQLRAPWWRRFIGLKPGQWMLTFYGAEAGAPFGMVGNFLEQNCPRCGHRTPLRVSEFDAWRIERDYRLGRAA